MGICLPPDAAEALNKSSEMISLILITASNSANKYFNMTWPIVNIFPQKQASSMSKSEAKQTDLLLTCS